jgi:DNA (cytosine-5)-methyltransferase 1
MAADLFAGAGGASTGLAQACDDLGVGLDLVAVNHWDVAIATHSRNHPGQRHYCAPVEAVDPREAVPGGRLDLLIAAPECTHHSAARGGRPRCDQKRASPFHILRWLDLLRVDVVLIENVPDLLTWGPLDANGKPLKARKGEIFRSFVAMLEAMNYRVEWQVLNSADYGEAQSRQRLFMQCRRRRTGGQMRWPEPTHTRDSNGDLLRDLSPWRAARDVIDWTEPSRSIFGRKKPLAPKTLARIIAGAERYWKMDLAPFLVKYNGTGGPCSPDDPLPTVTSRDRMGLVTPFLVPFLGEREGQAPRTRSLGDPLQTVTSSNPIGLCEPFIVVNNENNRPKGLDDPLPTVTGGNRHYLCEPFVLSQASGGAARPVSLPVPTIPCGGAHALVQPIPVDGGYLDIHFRMLQPQELAAAQGFPADYEFDGNKGETVKQIGNAISVRTAARCVARSSPIGCRGRREGRREDPRRGQGRPTSPAAPRSRGL